MTHILPPQPPPRLLSSEDILPTTRRVINQYQVVRDTVVQSVSPSEATFQNVIKPLIDVENATNGDIQRVAMLQYASPNQTSREASEKARNLFRECESEFTARTDIFLLVKAVKDRGESLDFEAAKYLDNLMKDFTRCGHGGLSPSQIEQYLKTRNQIDSLRQEFNRNIREEDDGVSFSLEDLSGVPDKDLARFGTDTEKGRENMRLVHFRRGEPDSVLKFATKQSTREKIYAAEAHRVPQNVDLFKRIIMLRDENARLLGCSSHASFRLEKRVAKTVKWVSGLFEGLEKALGPKGKEEIQALLQLKKKYLAEYGGDGESNMEMLTPWDYKFYTRIALDSYKVDHAKISEFFPLKHTMSAMLEIFASCLQLKFVPAPSTLVSGSMWHEDVEAWCVWDEREASNGAFIGYLFMDLLWRPGKYKGSQNVNLGCGYVKDDGTRVYPSTMLECCFPRATGSNCTLLEHVEIVSLFHELGHGIHDLVSRTSYTVFHGHRGSPDFIEAPSVMLENWCWMKDELKQMSCHYTKLGPDYLKEWQKVNGDKNPPETIPASMLDGLLKSRELNRALWFLGQLAYSRFDMAVHSPLSHQVCEEMDPTGLYNDFMERTMFRPHPKPQDRGYPHATFGHLVSGYDAGYYSYLSAHVFAADLFETKFTKDPRNQAVWEDYRRTILEPGGGINALETLESFLGHAPSPSALLQSFRAS